MGYQLSKTIVLVGLMGAGKTAIGTIVAQKLGCRFIDSDDEIETAAQMTIAEIFARDGEAFFRLKESQVLQRLLDGPPCLLSTGGGAFMSADNRAAIADKGVAVWLDADLDLLWARVKSKATRPLLQGPDPYGTLEKLFIARKPKYALAEIKVKAGADLSKEQMADKVIAELLNTPESGLKKVG
ncbi:shikimate kinase [Amylibacter kogurei]|uniref:Shikimate kinase n=1 Tax=Paramylibacter kogurei TaxID=1889778 RepID=A0A2G5K7M7_9RHOB|nr:shikimate kinase [Amylibacter kogurei]PIB24870.1 shikimate kinase [Amylibacter kogurei]